MPEQRLAPPGASTAKFPGRFDAVPSGFPGVAPRFPIRLPASDPLTPDRLLVSPRSGFPSPPRPRGSAAGETALLVGHCRLPRTPPCQKRTTQRPNPLLVGLSAVISTTALAGIHQLGFTPIAGLLFLHGCVIIMLSSAHGGCLQGPQTQKYDLRCCWYCSSRPSPP